MNQKSKGESRKAKVLSRRGADLLRPIPARGDSSGDRQNLPFGFRAQGAEGAQPIDQLKTLSQPNGQVCAPTPTRSLFSAQCHLIGDVFQDEPPAQCHLLGDMFAKTSHPSSAFRLSPSEVRA